MSKADQDIRLTYSCVVSDGKKKMVRVRFDRDDDYAEGIIPEGSIEKQKGFTKEEVEQLEQYLRKNRKEIIEKAKQITGIKHWFS